ncbi:MAG: PadR family transcriptional regulator [Acidimicrobiales bacterium]
MNDTAASMLGFLHIGPMSGWDLEHAVQLRIGRFWNVTRSQIYRELRTLEAAGYVQAGEIGPRSKRPMSITAAGRQAFSEWIAREPGPENIRMPMLLTLSFGALVDEDRLVELLTADRSDHQARLDYYRGLEPLIGEADRWARYTLWYGIVYEQGVLDWYDQLPWFGGDGPGPVRSSGDA